MTNGSDVQRRSLPVVDGSAVARPTSKELPVAEAALRFDPDDLTVGDLEDFEDIAGKSLEEVFNFDPSGKVTQVKMDAKSVKALVYIIKRKTDPEFTIEQARDVKLTALEVASPADPKSAAAASK